MKRLGKQKSEDLASKDAGKDDLAAALDRLNECYRLAVDEKDNRTAFAVQREINRLMGLGPGGDGSPAPADGAGASMGAAMPETPAPEAPPRAPPGPNRRDIENRQLADVVAAIEGHLDPLGLSDDVNDTDADLIRAAGKEIRRLRTTAGRTKGKQKIGKSGGKKH